MSKSFKKASLSSIEFVFFEDELVEFVVEFVLLLEFVVEFVPEFVVEFVVVFGATAVFVEL